LGITRQQLGAQNRISGKRSGTHGNSDSTVNYRW
jgi:hypothetical protein